MSGCPLSAGITGDDCRPYRQPRRMKSHQSSALIPVRRFVQASAWAVEFDLVVAAALHPFPLRGKVSRQRRDG